MIAQSMIKQLAFLHIPKTGGRTMIKFCRQFYQPGEYTALNNIRNGQVNGAKFIHSHFPYDTLPPTDERLVFTLLREPGMRIASYYQMCLRSGPENWPEFGRFWRGGRAMPLRDFAANHIQMHSQVENAMVRQLAGYDVLTSLRPVMPADLARAKANLATLMVGFTEQFDAFVTRLCTRMGWVKPGHYKSVNVSMPYHVDAADLDAIREMNRYDVALYEWAKENLA